MGEDDDDPNNPKRQKTEGYEEIEDFSKPITTFKGDTTGIFWDVEDYPFPVNYSPDEIYEKIETALRDIGGWRGSVMSIWAYVDEKKGSRWCQFLGTNKTWNSRIYFIPGGDRPARLTRMFHDIELWTLDNGRPEFPKPSYVIVFCEKLGSNKQFVAGLTCLRVFSTYHVIWFCPPSEDLPPEDSGWPGIIIDQGCYDFDPDNRMDGPLHICMVRKMRRAS